MFCTRCGKEIVDDAVMCVGCGNLVKPANDDKWEKIKEYLLNPTHMRGLHIITWLLFVMCYGLILNTYLCGAVFPWNEGYFIPFIIDILIVFGFTFYLLRNKPSYDTCVRMITGIFLGTCTGYFIQMLCTEFIILRSDTFHLYLVRIPSAIYILFFVAIMSYIIKKKPTNNVFIKLHIINVILAIIIIFRPNLTRVICDSNLEKVKCVLVIMMSLIISPYSIYKLRKK
jgi:hypothetical protein